MKPTPNLIAFDYIVNPLLEEGKYLLLCPYCKKVQRQPEKSITEGSMIACHHCKTVSQVTFRPVVSFHLGGTP